MTAKLNTSSQKKAGAKRYWPKTTFSQMAPVTMIVSRMKVLKMMEIVAASYPPRPHETQHEPERRDEHQELQAARARPGPWSRSLHRVARVPQGCKAA
jgi:hypothetical protein